MKTTINLDLPTNFLVVRTPLYALNDIDSFNSIEAILDFYRGHPYALKALQVASPNLYTEVIQCLDGTKKVTPKMVSTLLKYLLRMHYRCTPFGLFAGISRGEVSSSPQNDFTIETDEAQYRVDMDCLCALIRKLEAAPNLKTKLKYSPNPTLYKVGDYFRYVEYRLSTKNKGRTHHLVGIDALPHIDLVIEQARQGVLLSELVEVLLRWDSELSEEDIWAFLEQMVSSQVLVSELMPAVTGNELPLDRLITQLLNLEDKAVIVLQEMRDELQNVTDITKTLQKIEQQFEMLELKVNPARLLQVDTYRKTTNPVNITPEMLEDIKQSMLLLHNIERFRSKHNESKTNLGRFKKKFYERYEESEVPLLEVLDNEVGIGFPVNMEVMGHTPVLLKNIGLGSKGYRSSTYDWSLWQQFLLSKYSEAIANKDQVLRLTDKELKEEGFFSDDKQLPVVPLPNSMYVMANVVSEEKTHWYYHFAAGPSAANLLGRFCYLDEQLTENLRQSLKEEERQNPQVIYAELTHLPEDRVGNISLRPVLRDYEIPLLAKPAVDAAHVISLDDLLISVPRGQKVVIRSKKLNKEVIPRLSTAHNFHLKALPVYQFLCELQHQSMCTYLGWDWGALEKASFLPRVVYNKTILAPAQWAVPVKQLRECKKRVDFDAMLFKNWKSQGLPQKVVLADGDNELPLDIDNPLCVTLIYEKIQNSSGEILMLKECLKMTSNQLTNEYSNEVVIPISVTSAKAKEKKKSNQKIESQQKTHERLQNNSRKEPLLSKQEVGVEVVRSFYPGDEHWLYVKVYCGIKNSDRLLTEFIKPWVNEALQKQEVKQWFFIRYYDEVGGGHLRLRFKGEDSALILKSLHKVLIYCKKLDLVTFFQVDTYQRELERYGALNIENSEQLFFYDSQAVVALLDLLELEDPSSEEYRWLLAAMGIDRFLTDFGYDLTRKKALLEVLKDGFAREFGAGKYLKKQLSEKFRQCRQDLRKALLTPEETPLVSALEIFEMRSIGTKEVFDEVTDLRTANAQVPTDLEESYIHMWLNRMFGVKQRAQEMVIYDLLFQHYRSEIARQAKVLA